MNILWVASPLTDTRGGALTVTKNLINGLKSDKHIYLGSCRYMGCMFEENNSGYVSSFPGFEPVTIKNWLLMPVSFVLGFIQIVKHRKLYQNTDRIVVATAHTEVFFTIPWVLLWFKKPAIIMNHTGRCPQSLYKNPLKFVMEWVYNHSQVIFVSNAHKDMWEKHNLIGKSPNIVYNGVKINDFEPRLKQSKSSIIFGYLGRIEEQKGLDTLFEALEKVQISTSVEFFIGGVGYSEEKYKAWSSKIMAKNEQIAITWLGQVNDTRVFFDSIDCLIFPSKFESFGLVMVEAWERGVPVISSDIEAFKELKNFVDEEERTLMFETENGGDLADMLNLYIQTFDRQSDGERSIRLHSVAESNFSTDIQITKFKSLL